MKLRYALAIISCFAISHSVVAASPPDKPAAKTSKFVAFEVIVKFKPDAKLSSLKSQMKDVEFRSSSSFIAVAKLNVPSPKLYRADEAKTETLAFLKRMRERSDVEYAQLNYLFNFSSTPNDPLYGQQWHYPLISLPNAWDITRGSGDIKIAILDSGRSGHPDLNGRFSTVEFNGIQPGAPATDDGPWRHGTHVAGIAGAASNNGIGGAGVCQGCQLLNAKIGDASTGISAAAIISSINWAVDNGANVINMSFEQPRACTQADLPVLRDAIRRAVDSGVSVIASAGNNAVNVDNVSPASCPGVMSVAATDRNNNIATYSSRGSSIGVAAPGGATFYGAGIGCPADDSASFNPSDFGGAVSTFTTSPASGNAHCYRHLGGTSMAAPHVAGTVGLMLSVNPGLRPNQIRSLVQSTASGLPSCGSDCGPGLLNAYAAVNSAQFTTTGPCSANSGGTCKIDSISQYTDSSGSVVESVVAYGYQWQFDINGNSIAKTKKLRALPNYASGPCAYTPAGQECTIDTSTALDYPGFGYIDSVTAYGRYWNFDRNGADPTGTNGSLLSSVPRYASGPCAYARSADTCRFDTRNVVNWPEFGGVIESINAYGRYWIFDASGNLIGSDALTAVERYRTGPCAYTPAGQVCTFDSRDVRRSGSGMIETITAYGHYFEWDINGQPTANHNVPLSSIARMR
jgi:subtilisin family serine protease